MRAEAEPLLRDEEQGAFGDARVNRAVENIPRKHQEDNSQFPPLRGCHEELVEVIFSIVPEAVGWVAYHCRGSLEDGHVTHKLR